MKILDRYILKELLPPFLVSLGALVGIIIIQQLLRLMELFVGRGMSGVTLIKVFLVLLPTFLVICVPMAALTATLTTFTRLSTDREILAVQATGVGIRRLLVPVLIFSLGATLLTSLLSVWASPWRGVPFKSLALKLAQQRASLVLEEGVFNTLFPNFVVYVENIPTFTGLKGVFISDLRNPDEPTLIVAQEGSILNTSSSLIWLRLSNGSIHQQGKDPLSSRKVLFSSYDLKLDLSDVIRSEKLEETFSYGDLKKKIADTHGKDPYYLSLLHDYYKNYTFPLASLIFGLLGVPLGIYARSTGRLAGFAWGIALMALYYIFTIIGDFLVSSRVLPPFASAHLPNLLLLIPTLFLLSVAAHGGEPR